MLLIITVGTKYRLEGQGILIPSFRWDQRRQDTS